LTKKFLGENGVLKKLSCVRVEIQKGANGCPAIKELSGTEFEIEADLAILALGFLYPEKSGPIQELGLELDQRSNVKTDEDFQTSSVGLFSCGDMHRGQSLIVWAIAEGRRAAHCIDKYLMGESSLPVI
jgi:glutamate synthase (NADPH/NADH) small chain